MVKEKRILSYFLGWFLVGYIIFVIGTNNVFASTYTGFNYTAQLYDNFGPTLSAVTTSGPTSGTGYYEGYIGFTAYTSGGAWGISSPTALIANHTYTLTAQIINECSQPILSTYNRIGVGTSLSNAVSSYQNNTNVDEVYSKALSGNQYLIQFAFTPTINSSYIIFPFATSQTCDSSRVFLNNISMEDLGETGVSQDQINTSLSNQTNEINSSIQSSTDTITGEIDDMEQSIIDNQNQNNEKLIEELKKGQLTCGYNYKEEFKYSNLNNTGAIVGGIIENNSNFKYSEPTIIFGGYEYEVSGYNTGTSNRYLIAVYDSEMNYLFDFNYKNNTILDLSSYEGILYIVANVNANEVNNLVIVQKNGICVPTSYLQMKQNQETNDKLDGIEGALTDTSSPDLEILGDSAGWLPPGPLDSVLNLPLTMLNSLTNSLGKTCTPLNLKLPYVNKNIQIPCLSSIFAQITGVNGLWTWVGTIASVLILYNYLLNLYAWVDRVLTLRAEFDEAMGADMANWGRL